MFRVGSDKTDERKKCDEESADEMRPASCTVIYSITRGYTVMTPCGIFCKITVWACGKSASHWGAGQYDR
jgi:hypothetical protein